MTGGPGWISVREAAARAGVRPDEMAGMLLGWVPLVDVRGPDGTPLFSDVDAFEVREVDLERVLARRAASMMSQCARCGGSGCVVRDGVVGLCPDCHPDRGPAWTPR